MNCGNLLISVRMRAPFAPHMSFGSRATQAKPEAQSSCSEQYPEAAYFLRVTAGLRQDACKCKSFFYALDQTTHRCANRGLKIVRVGE